MSWRAVPLIALAGLLLACGRTVPSASPAEEDDPLLAAGQAFYWGGEYERAEAEWGAALAAARAGNDRAGEARLLTWLGLAALRTGDYAASREHGEAALALKRLLGNRNELARSYLALGLLAEREERYADALVLYDQARAAAEFHGQAEIIGAAAGNSGLVHAYLGDFERAAQLLREMRLAGRETRRPLLEANALNNLGMVAIWSGDPAAAIAPLDTARALYLQLDYRLGEQHVLGQVATARAAMGEYEVALAAIDTALILARHHGLRDQEAENLLLLAGLHADLGDPRSALRHLDSSGELFRELGMPSERARALLRAAMIRRSLGAAEHAYGDATEALAAHRVSGQRFEELEALLLLAEMHQGAGRAAERDAELELARALAREMAARSALSAVSLAEARIAEIAGDHPAVLEAALRVEREALEADYRPRLEAHSLAARAHAALGRLESAAAEGRKAVHALERVRGGLSSQPLRGSFTAASARVYGDLVLILLQLGHTEEAFAIADAARSDDLLARLTRASARRGAGDQAIPPQNPAEAELLLRRIDALLLQVREMEETPPLERGPGSEGTMQDVLRRLQGLREEYEAIAIRAPVPRGGEGEALLASSIDEARVRSALYGDEVLLHYTITADRTILFVLRPDGVESMQIPIAAADLAARIRLLRELWGDREAPHQRGVPAAEGLYRLLVEPALAAGLLHGVERLLIVTDGVLEQLPFAALRNPSSGRFLVEDFVLTHARSANEIPALRAPAHPAPQSWRNASAFAPFPALLPGTRAEARVISAGRGRRVRVGRWATEGAVRRALERPGIVHVASHGVLNARNPMFSRIKLARGRGAGSANDGRLEVHEVLNLVVRSGLVVLSGCETGLTDDWSGDPLRPAGVTSLGQAFLHAGARNVVATLWRVDDLGSADLMRHFYRGIGAGDFSQALALAQRAMIADPAYAAPYHWAGFLAMGEGRRGTSAQELALLAVQ
jgi:CHAT domain-containing protein/tetratricopeptide (TPR) repeat protein